MTFAALLFRNLFYHWRGNLAVLLGIIIGTAVLTGALFVGDSLRGSLQARAVEQLGWVEHALVSNRFFREKLAEDLKGPAVAPVILLQGNAQAGGRRANKVTILGVDSRYLAGKSLGENPKDPPAEVNLNIELARALNVKPGDKITLNVHKADDIPRETLLGKRKAEDVVEPLTLTVKSILPAGATMANFSLKPTPEAVRNAFVPLKYLQERLGVGERINAVVAAGDATLLGDALRTHLTLDDWNLRLRDPEDRARAFFRYLDPRGKGALTRVRWRERVPDELATAAEKNNGLLTVEHVIDFYQKHRNYVSLESSQMFLEPAVVRAVDDMVKAAGRWQAQPVLVYLADKISDGQNEIPYAVVAATSPPPAELKDDEILLVDWPSSPLKAKPGDKITVEYYSPDAQGRLQLLSHSFQLRGNVPLAGAHDDPDLTPEFPGITDKLDMASWENPPFPYSAKRVKPRDEEYWKRHRATPKAFVTLKTGQKLWGNRFGSLTSIKLTSSDKPAVARALLGHLKAEQGGFVFDSVRQRNLASSAGATDFGVLFLAFSFFLIVSALMLIGLLFRLNLDRRAREVGVLLAVGLRRGRLRTLLLLEGLILAVGGGAIGLGLAVVYASLMLDLLRARWPDGQSLAFLNVHVEAKSFVIGYVSALAVSFLTIVWATRVLAKLTPRDLLAGQTTSSPPLTTGGLGGSNLYSRWIAAIALIGGIAALIVGSTAENHNLKAGSFFGAGALLLTAGLAGASWMMRRSRRSLVTHGSAAIARLGARNATRHVARSLLTAGLLASATFLIVSVEVFHKDAGEDFYQRTGGSGGFSFFAEADVPIFENLNDPKAWSNANLQPEDAKLLKEVKFFPFRVRAGDDASCLNLYQPLKPRILGVPKSLIERGGFHVTSMDQADRPWRELETGPQVLAFVDANSAQWILKVGLGDKIEVETDYGDKRKLQIAGLLHESIFQSEVLIAEDWFVRLFPRQGGFQFFLIDGPKDKLEKIKSIVENGLASYGVSVAATGDRLRAYLAVENTYLAVFQALGGLGLVLGALGLSVVLVRSVWERRGELALLRALGFRERLLGWLVLAENAFLLLLGLLIGAASALVAVAPHVLGMPGRVQWQGLVILLVTVIVVGLGACAAAVAATLRAPLLTALRRE